MNERGELRICTQVPSRRHNSCCLSSSVLVYFEYLECIFYLFPEVSTAVFQILNWISITWFSFTCFSW